MRLIFALAMLSASLAVAEEKPVEIPLKTIWAVNMPGTRDIGIFNSVEAAENSVVTKTLQQVRDSWDHDEGMAVQGEGLKAVGEFYRIRTEKLPRNQVLANLPVSLVFYTPRVGDYVHLQRVERRGNRFTIQYRFEPHQAREITQHLAVIPIGKIPAGKYDVEIERLPSDKRYVERGYKATPKQINSVCKSFSFLVREPEVQR